MRNTHFVSSNASCVQFSRKITRAQNFSRFASPGPTVTGQKSIYYEQLSQLNFNQATSIIPMLESEHGSTV